MFHMHRTSKAQALQNMTTVLPTPKSERLQQNLESDWTPGSYISQEEVSFDTPPQPDEALMKINEGLEKIEKCCEKRRSSPLSSLMETKWERAGEEEKTQFVRKATEACKMVCSAIAPEAGEKLFQAVCKKEDPDIENELKPLLQAYKNAPTKDSKTQILSIYANNYPAKKLIEMHKFYEPLTEWELRKAKIHANHNGPGAPLEKPVYHRVKLDSVKVTHFLEFINRPYFHQDVAYGTRTLNLSSGEKLVMPNVIRTVTRSTMVSQYLQLCQEEDFEPLSRATMYRILEVREASQRKALHGLDNVAADGATAFASLLKITDELQNAGADPDWCAGIKEKLNQAKRYLKTDYKVHCKEECSPCADHCRVFALSDPVNEAFTQECEHLHNLQCDMCENLKSVVEEIEVSLKNQSQNVCFYSKEQQDDILFDFSQSKKLIFDWKAHIMRSENQDQAKQDALKSLDETSTLITMDWAMKFQCQKYREKQSEWFGKRGLSWHVSSAVFKTGPKEEPTVTTYAHLFDSCNQDWFAVASILENVLQLLKKEHPSITKAYLRSDEAGCYHNNFLICSIREISHRTGISIEQYDFSEPQHGKDICDRIICPMKLAVRRFCDEGHDIQAARDMREALLERPVKGVTAAVCEVNDKQRTIDVFKITHFSAYHNFEFGSGEIRARKAYSVGQGTSLNYSDILRTPQGPTSIVIKRDQEFFSASSKKNVVHKEGASVQTSASFSCPQAGCSLSFTSFDSLQSHLDYEQHEIKTSQESIYDQFRRDWAARFSTIHSENRLKPKVHISSVANSSIPMGWALQKPRVGGKRYSPHVKDYLKARFDAGEQSGQKADPQQVSMDMRNARTEENNRLFSREEWLTRNQVQSYFSRLSALKRKQVSGPPSNQPGLVDIDIDDLIQEDDWLQQVGEVYENLSVQHPIYYDAYNLCDLHKRKRIASFNVEMLKILCKHFGITFKSKDRKQMLVDKLTLMLEECSCTCSAEK